MRDTVFSIGFQVKARPVTEGQHRRMKDEQFQKTWGRNVSDALKKEHDQCGWHGTGEWARRRNWR